MSIQAACTTVRELTRDQIADTNVQVRVGELLDQIVQVTRDALSGQPPAPQTSETSELPPATTGDDEDEDDEEDKPKPKSQAARAKSKAKAKTETKAKTKARTKRRR